MWSDLVSTLKGLLMGIGEILAGIDVWTVLKNPWVIVLMAITCIVVVRGMNRVLVALLSIPAFLVLLQNTTQNFTVPDCYSEQLPIFVGGSLVIAAINLYVYLVRN